MDQNIWTICQFFVSTGTICHHFIFDDLSQVIFVTILFWTICHKSYLSQFYFGRFVTSHICHNFILDDLSQVIFVLDDMSQKRNVIWGDT